MKIFNWVHRRFNINNKAENSKNNGDIDIDEQYFPVNENKGNHVLERWRGGILTIGTLGYDPLKDENEQLADDYFYEEEDQVETEEEEEEEEEEEQNPMVVANAEVAEMEMAENEEQQQQQFGYEYMMMKKEERITLADLFSADADDPDDLDLDQDQKQAMNKIKPAELLVKERSFHRKHALSKLIIAKEARPIHKFNQLMRRMLKRKIHPDVGPTSIDDSASLLPTQVIADAKI